MDSGKKALKQEFARRMIKQQRSLKTLGFNFKPSQSGLNFAEFQDGQSNYVCPTYLLLIIWVFPLKYLEISEFAGAKNYFKNVH